MMRKLIRRVLPATWRPALVAAQFGADSIGTNGQPWSPTWEIDHAPERAEPEETLEEATLREFAEIVDHWAAEEQRIADEVRSWFDELPSIKNDPIAAQLLAEERERLARKASPEAADGAELPTGEYPIVRELVGVAA